MKFLLKLFVFIVSLVVLVLVVALFVDSDFKVERETKASVDVHTSFTFIRHLENQESYGIWFQIDPDITIWYEGTPGEIGSKICWSSKNKEVGRGEQEIVAIQEGKRIDFKLRFFAPEKMESDLYITTTAVSPNSTKIIWGMTGEVPYPWNLSLLFTDMDKEVGKDFEQGLKNLRILLEQDETEADVY